MKLADGLKFFTENLKNANMVGAVWPSSPALAAAMVEPVLRDRTKPLRVLEVGPGLGPCTERLMPALGETDVYDIVELNPTFCAALRDRFPTARVFERSILDHEAEPYDWIVSGLPLANFPADVVAAIYSKFFSLLRPDGRFVMFEYLVIRQALAGLTVGAERARVKQILQIEAELLPLQVEQIDVLANVPPARVRVRRQRG